MRISRTFTLLFLQFVYVGAFSSGSDSLLYIDEVKRFAYNEIGYNLNGDFFNKWTNEEKPYIYLYVSLSDSIKRPTEFNYPYIFCGTDEDQANIEETKFTQRGYHTFCYKTNANSAALLNKRLLSYSKDAIAFIIFHELTHHYLDRKNIKIPYEFNEALCDVVGNYGALNYSMSTQNLDLASVKNQIKSNEKIYKCLNEAISNINKNPKKTIVLNAKCQAAINDILKNANLFQKDRFDYHVNNAYLLKNEYYCKHYFLLKKVFLKLKTLKAFLELMKTLPENSSDCEKYLKKFTQLPPANKPVSTMHART